MGNLTYEFLKENDLILFEAIVGSQSYGLSTPTSDIDRKFIYICPINDLFGNSYQEQLIIDDDYNGYEIGRFLQLVQTNNPNILELLNTPEDCIEFKHPIYDQILEHRDKFITKGIRNSLAGYAQSQISKSNGLSKKQNWEANRIERKDMLDFCYVISGGDSIPWKVWNSNESENAYEEMFLGITNLTHVKDTYSVYYDGMAKNMFSEDLSEFDREVNKKHNQESGSPMGFGYKGLMKVGGSSNLGESNQLRLSSIPKNEVCICNLYYNKDAYSIHCREYKEYQDWLKNRNVNRYIDNKKHGQNFDSKNIMHLVRLLKMSREIAEGKGVIVRRYDREELLKIRRGEVILEDIVSWAKNEIIIIDKLYAESNLPDKVDFDFINNLLISIRRSFYNL